MARTTDPKKPRLDPRLTERLTRKKAQLDRYRPLPSETVRRLNEDLRVFLTYYSNAIEGNTLSLQEMQMVIDYGLTIGGHPLREYLEVTNHAAAYSYMASPVEGRAPLTRETILELHRLVMNRILEAAGQFRTVPVFIRGANMTPPPASRVESLMREGVAWIGGEGKQYAPVVRAAIAHHGEDRGASLHRWQWVRRVALAQSDADAGRLSARVAVARLAHPLYSGA